MSDFGKGVATLGLLFGAGIFAYVLMATAPSPEVKPPAEVATAVRVLQVQQGPVQLEVRSQGAAVPQIQSELVPEVSGRAQWVSGNLVPGGYFTAGETLLRLDARDYQSAVARRQATLERAEAEEELARFELGRMDELLGRGLVSASNRETVLRNHRIAKASLADARLALEEAQRDLARTEIKAPYNGLVRSEKVDEGQYLSRGQSIASIYASAAVEVPLPVADRQLAYLDLPLGYRGEVAAEAAPEVLLATDYGGQRVEWRGRLVRTEAEIDARSRMVTAVARVANAQAGGQPDLPIGLFVSARIMGRWVEDAVILPRSALRNQSQVLVVDESARLRFREVEILRFDQDTVILSGGLHDGETVNISPLQTVVDGMKVIPQRQPQTQALGQGGQG